MSIYSYLTKRIKKGLFFPSHIRGNALPKEIKSLLKKKPGSWDLPDIPELISPLRKDGIIAISQEETAVKIGVKKCWYGVNGASGLIHAAILSIAKEGENILMPRNVHKSILNACLIGKINPIFFDVPFSFNEGHYLVNEIISLKDAIDRIIQEGITISSVVLIHPTYHGYAGDIKAMVNCCHKRKLPVLVDEAHGSHFLFFKDIDLPLSAVNCGADLVVHSLHKSLNGLTQTAVLWGSGDLVDLAKVESNLQCLQTTSPNSLLLASCESAINEMIELKENKKFKKRILKAREISSALKDKGLPIIPNQDPLKLIINTSHFLINGIDADKFFIRKGLIAELPEPFCITFALGFGSHFNLVNTLNSYWRNLLNEKQLKKETLTIIKPIINSFEMLEIPIHIAYNLEFELVSIENSINRICSEFICPYPPGIPIFIPGERINKNKFNYLNNQCYLWRDSIETLIKVVKE
tara:strand:+ start:2912 stop:4312 length:1401 start_codon:yes stop_codon:yes gene_type:complete